jgi:hypothetical protein
MSNFYESIVSVSGRLTHQWDFTFYKNNGEIANRIQAELGPGQKITIDREGDIEIETNDVGTFYVTAGGIIAAGWLTDSKSILVHQEIGRFTHKIELVAKSKGSFTPETYNVRLFFRFRPENSLNLLRDRSFQSTLQLILGEKAPSDVQSLKSSTTHTRGKFLDFIELEASSKDVQLRYGRSGNGADFSSYSAFVEAADLAGIMKDLKPFAEVLLQAEPQRLRPIGGLLSDMK